MLVSSCVCVWVGGGYSNGGKRFALDILGFSSDSIGVLYLNQDPPPPSLNMPNASQGSPNKITESAFWSCLSLRGQELG